MSLEAPSGRPELEACLNDFKHSLDNLEYINNIPNITRKTWGHRIQQLEDMMGAHSAPVSRSKRGLFNFVSAVGQKLYGFATEAEVNDQNQRLCNHGLVTALPCSARCRAREPQGPLQ